MTQRPPPTDQRDRHPVRRGRERLRTVFDSVRARAVRWTTAVRASPDGPDGQPQSHCEDPDRFEPGETDAGEAAETDPVQEPATLVDRPDVPKGTTPEEFAVAMLEANGGQLPWRVLRDELGWSDSASRRILENLHERGYVGVSSDAGNRKVVSLREDAPASVVVD